MALPFGRIGPASPPTGTVTLVRVAITGSSGLVGTALRARLEAEGHTAVRVVRGEGRPGTITWDPAAGRLDPADLEGLDGVVHLAGEGIGAKRWNAAQKQRILESRSKGTALLSEALAATADRPPVLVSGSAIGFYGDRGDEELTEGSGSGSDFLSEICRAWESATGLAEAAGVRVAHLRTALVLDGEGGVLPRMALPFKVGLGGRLGSGRQWLSWITLADEVAAILFLLAHEVAGPVNAAAPGPVTNAAFSKALGRALHRPSLVPVPKFAPRLLLGREMADELLFVSQRVLPAVLQEHGFTFEHPVLEPALHSVLAR
jgi:uncharacterized protein (TIGR01777 family)